MNSLEEVRKTTERSAFRQPSVVPAFESGDIKFVRSDPVKRRTRIEDVLRLLREVLKVVRKIEVER